MPHVQNAPARVASSSAHAPLLSSQLLSLSVPCRMQPPAPGMKSIPEYVPGTSPGHVQVPIANVPPLVAHASDGLDTYSVCHRVEYALRSLMPWSNVTIS